MRPPASPWPTSSATTWAPSTTRSRWGAAGGGWNCCSEQGTNRYYPHGLGKHFLWDAERNTGRRTILAYSRGPDGKYYSRANIFSGPHTKFDWHGAQVTTGTEEEDDVRVIRENR